MGKSTPQTTTSEQKTNMGPWQPQQPYLTKAFSEAERLYDSYNPQYYEGSTVAGATPAMQQGWQQAIQRAQQGSPLVPAAQGMTLDTINGKYLDPSSNPYLASTYGQAADQVTRNYQTATAPATSAAFAGAGRYGSGARNQAVDQNQRALGASLNNLATQIYGGNYQTERDRQMAAGGMAPGMVQAGYLEPSILSGIGAQQQQQNQNELNDQVARWNYNQQLPYNKLNSYLGAVSGNYGQSGTVEGKQTQMVNSSPLMQGLGGLLSLGSTVGSLAMPGLGGVSAFGNMFGGKSDRRAKVNIKLIGKSFDDQNLYLFSYADDPTKARYVGLMAQEVELRDPEAVREFDGVKFVDYDRALAGSLA